MSKSSRRRRKKREAEAQPEPMVTVQVRDPIAELIEKAERMQHEYEQIMAEIHAAIAKRQDEGHEDALQHAGEMIEEAKSGRSAEELEQIRRIASREQWKDIGKMKAAIEEGAKQLLLGERLTYTPQVDDVIPYGGIQWGFTAGVQSKYPRVVIQAYEDKQRGLAELHRTKTMLGAAGPGYARQLEPHMIVDFVGQPRRPMAEHQRLLRERGINQNLEVQSG